MLTQMDVTNLSSLLSDTLTFHLDNTANQDLIQVHDITGLDPVTATVNTSQYGNIDGSYFTGASVPQRNIVITVGYKPDWVDNTIESLRLLLYSYFMPKQNIHLVISSTHLPTVEIDGIVESMEPNIYSQDPEVQISIINPDPYFVGVDDVVVDGETLSAHADVAPLIYTGSVETDIDLKVIVPIGDGAYSGPIDIYGGGIDETHFSVTATFDSANYLEFDSSDDGRAIDTVDIATSVRTSLIKSLGTVDWIKLQPGGNKLQVVTATGGQDWVLTYYPQFGGL